MKNQEEIENALSELGIPYQYYMFEEKEAIAPPFAVWYFDGSNNLYADGKTYCKIEKLNIELYTDRKDFELEKKLETIFQDEEICWEKTEGFLEDEQLYEVLYEMEVLING